MRWLIGHGLSLNPYLFNSFLSFCVSRIFLNYSTFSDNRVYLVFIRYLDVVFEMMLNRNQASYLRVAEIIRGLLEDALNKLIERFIADLIYRCGKIVYNWSKPSLIEYKNRAEFVFHYFAFLIGIESPFKFVMVYLRHRGSKSLINGLFLLIVGACLSSKPSHIYKRLKVSKSLSAI